MARVPLGNGVSAIRWSTLHGMGSTEADTNGAERKVNPSKAALVKRARAKSFLFRPTCEAVKSLDPKFPI